MTQPTEHWHISKTVNIGHIISTVLLAGTLAVGWMNMSEQVSSNAQAIQHQADINALEQKHLAEFKDEIRTRLQRIDDKLERLIERAE